MTAVGLRRVAVLTACLAILILLSACGNDQLPSPTPVSTGRFDIDPVFREFYENKLGGQATMGYAISPAIEQDGVILQYVTAGLMRYDRLAPTAQQFSLAPLGAALNIQNPPLDIPAQEGVRVENGLIIYPKFLELYERLERTRFAGEPVSQVRVEAERNRIVQYFQNVGFYTSSNDPADGVHLLAYGAMACRDCDFDTSGTRYDSAQPSPALSQPYLPVLNRLGADFAGQPLSEPYRAPDGMIEQVYTNVVVFSAPDNMKTINLRPLPRMVGIEPGPLAIRIVADGLVFKPLQDGLGHNVAIVFDQYVALHGGLDLAGEPTSEIFQAGAVYRQCFTNYCLDFDPAAPQVSQIRPAPLGEAFLNRFPPEAPANESLTLLPERLFVKVWEEKALIPSSEAQNIFLKVMQRSDQSAIPNLGATLTITLPDGSEQAYELPATDAQGQSSVKVGGIAAPNGTLIPYRVCLATASGPQVCQSDAYVIWSNP